MTPKPEFSRLLPVDRVPEEGCLERLEAGREECAALALRFAIPAVNRVTAALRAEPWRRGAVRIRGTAEAEIVQQCVITLDEFASVLEVEVDRVFDVVAGKSGARPEVVLVDVADEDEPDVIEDGAIDLGEVVAETLALNLEAYPRKPGAHFAASGPAPDGGKPASPFAALARLRSGNDGKT